LRLASSSTCHSLATTIDTLLSVLTSSIILLYKVYIYMYHELLAIA
jgi:hypothetical protein